MPHPMKAATCCYCGRRTVLQPTARQGHELACGSCGAPLHEMKALRRPAPDKIEKKPAKPEKKAKKPKKSKPFWQKALGEVFDVVEDIFD